MTRPCAPCWREPHGRVGKSNPGRSRKWGFAGLAARSRLAGYCGSSWRGTSRRFTSHPMHLRCVRPCRARWLTPRAGARKERRMAYTEACTRRRISVSNPGPLQRLGLRFNRTRPAYSLPIASRTPVQSRSRSRWRCLRSTATPGISARWSMTRVALANLAAARSTRATGCDLGADRIAGCDDWRSSPRRSICAGRGSGDRATVSRRNSKPRARASARHVSNRLSRWTSRLARRVRSAASSIPLADL